MAFIYLILSKEVYRLTGREGDGAMNELGLIMALIDTASNLAIGVAGVAYVCRVK